MISLFRKQKTPSQVLWGRCNDWTRSTYAQALASGIIKEDFPFNEYIDSVLQMVGAEAIIGSESSGGMAVKGLIPGKDGIYTAAGGNAGSQREVHRPALPGGGP